MKKIIAVLMLCLTVFSLTACKQHAKPEAEGSAPFADTEWTEYLASIETQAGSLQESLEKDEMTQTEMNLKAGQLSALWDEAMNRLLEEAKQQLPASEWEQLSARQNVWLENRTKRLEEAGQDVQGGSMYSLVVNMEAARLAKARVQEIYDLLK